MYAATFPQHPRKRIAFRVVSLWIRLMPTISKGLGGFFRRLEPEIEDGTMGIEEECHLANAAPKLRELPEGACILRVGWTTPAHSRPVSSQMLLGADAEVALPRRWKTVEVCG